MKRILKKITSLESSLVFFDENGRVSDRGNLRGDVSGLRGDVSYLRGDVDDAEISDRDREKGINISDLIEE